MLIKLRKASDAIASNARDFFVEATTIRIGSVVGSAALLFSLPVRAQNLGDDATYIGGQLKQFGELFKLAIALIGIGLVGFGVYTFAVLRKQDPREHSIGKCLGMLLGGGAMASIGFLTSHMSASIFANGAQTSGMDDLGVTQ